MQQQTTTFPTLRFDNKALRDLPVDTLNETHPRTVRGACFSTVKPTPVKNPKLIAISEDALANLVAGSSSSSPKDLFTSEFVEKYFSGNEILPGSETASHCYCGHQFGYFAGQLGDGAAIYLGEIVNGKEERWEFQLKGAGLTPYSRSADGRKVLRSSVREFLCSEANHFLGIPTTRAGSVVTSDSFVARDALYSGNEVLERCSIVLRIAQTFMRFGSFEIFKLSDPQTGMKGPSYGLKNEMLPRMLDYTISTFFPEIHKRVPDDQIITRYEQFFREIVRRTANLVADWQCVGFCHGVLNTDNMSIVGLTLDYGPFGFMDSFDPDNVCNSSDHGGRYSYKEQPSICKWNCLKLAEALDPMLPLEISKKIVAETYTSSYTKSYIEKMRKKLGLIQTEKEEDVKLIESFLETLAETGGDFTCSFRALSSMNLAPENENQELTQQAIDLMERLLSYSASAQVLIRRCKTIIPDEKLDFVMNLLQRKPEMLPMLGIEVETVKLDIARRKKLKSLNEFLQSPSAKKKRDEDLWKKWLLMYQHRLNAELTSALRSKNNNGDNTKSTGDPSESVSQGNKDHDNSTTVVAQDVCRELNQIRIRVMDGVNPVFILRNHIAQRAIEMAEDGDYSEVNRVLQILQDPFAMKEENKSDEIIKRYHSPPSSDKIVCVSCSS